VYLIYIRFERTRLLEVLFVRLSTKKLLYFNNQKINVKIQTLQLFRCFFDFKRVHEIHHSYRLFFFENRQNYIIKRAEFRPRIQNGHENIHDNADAKKKKYPRGLSGWISSYEILSTHFQQNT